MTTVATISMSASITESAALQSRSGAITTKIGKILQLLDGTGAGQFSKSFSPASAPAVAQSVNTDYDLSGTLGATFGNVAFTAVKGIIVLAGAANPGLITLFGGTNPFLGPLSGTVGIALSPGMPFQILKTDASGWPVTNSSNDNFRIATAATTGTYTWEMAILGI